MDKLTAYPTRWLSRSKPAAYRFGQADSLSYSLAEPVEASSVPVWTS
ncbi:MAG: hypothetical protein ACYC3P_10505 [Bellilinea sp.]